MQAERLRRRAGVRHDGGVSVAGGTGVASRKFALSRTRQTSPHWFPALQPYRRTKLLLTPSTCTLVLVIGNIAAQRPGGDEAKPTRRETSTSRPSGGSMHVVGR